MSKESMKGLTYPGEAVFDISEKAFKSGQQSCAASPWTYRTDTGDEYGKVVESVELPEKPRQKYLMMYHDMCRSYGIGVLTPTFTYTPWVVRNEGRTEDWLRKHLIAWAEIRR